MRTGAAPSGIGYRRPALAEDAPHHPDLLLARRLAAGDEAALVALARAHHAAMVRFAGARVGRGSPIVEEAVQEAWVVLLEKLDRFEGRSSLRTFLFGILVQVLRNRARAEKRSVPLSSAVPEDEGPTVSADRFHDASALWAGHWSAPPARWDLDPIDAARTRALLEEAIAALPEAQREVLTLRDVLGWDGPEVCEALGLSEANQRVLLHRARAKVRAALEAHAAGGAPWK